jgi:hypothetical protein
MSLTTANGEVLSLQIVCFSSDGFKSLGRSSHFLMAINELSHEVFPWLTSTGHRRKIGELGESLKSTFSIGIKSPNTFGNFINCAEERFILALECRVKLEEIRALHIPVREMGLRHQRVAVGQKFVKGGHDRIGGYSVGYCFRRHGILVIWGFDEILWILVQSGKTFSAQLYRFMLV